MIIYIIMDYETRSACNLKTHGSYVYAQHPTTTVTCATLLIGSPTGPTIFWTEEPQDFDLPAGFDAYETGRDFLAELITHPREVLDALFPGADLIPPSDTTPDGVILVPHNVDFERPISIYTLGLPEPLAWSDTCDRMRERGLPAGADDAGMYLTGMGKDKDGHALMMRLCRPDRRGAMRMPTCDEWHRYASYNRRDVAIGATIVERYGLWPVPEWEAKANILHQEINHRGIYLDQNFCRNLQGFDAFFKREAGRVVEEVTQGAIVAADLTRTEFLRQELIMQLPAGYPLPNMRQATLEELMEDAESGEIDVDPAVIQVVKCRLIATRASLAKVDAALESVTRDGRIKSTLVWHAAHTGRFGGRKLQVQNLKRPDDSFDLASATQAIETNDRTRFEELCQGRPPYELLSSLIRGIIAPAPGNVFVVGDYASVESRGLQWLNDDHEGLADHRAADAGLGPDVYCRLAETVYGRPITKADKKERQAGKMGELAGGYGGGVNAVLRFATATGLDFAELGLDPQVIVDAWRTKHACIVRGWHDAERAFRRACHRPGRTFEAMKCTFTHYGDRLEIVLPSGRPLIYQDARVGTIVKYGKEYSDALIYTAAKNGKRIVKSVYGGLLAENITQAFCRDLLVDAMLKTEAENIPIVFHVHDEEIAEVEEERAAQALTVMGQILQNPPAWATGLPLASKPEIMRRYGK